MSVQKRCLSTVKDWFLQNSRAKRLEKLKFDLDRSPIVEMKEMMQTNGKLFTAPQQLIPASESKKISEDILSTPMKSLTGELVHIKKNIISTHQATLVTVSFTSFSDPMVDSFRDPFLAKYSLNKRIGLLDLRPIPSQMKYAIWAPLSKFSSRRSIPFEQQHNYFLYRGGQELRAGLGIPNLFGGYIFLVDQDARIRWNAAGFATDEELSLMHEFTAQLAGLPTAIHANT